MEQPFSSTRTRSIEAGGTIVTSAWFAPSLRLGRHHHALGSVSVILAGGYDSVIGGAGQRCEAQTVVMTPPEEPHHNVFLPRATQMLVVELAVPVEGAPSPAVARPQALQNPGIAQLARRAALEVEHPDPYAKLACEGLALELLAMALRADAASDRRPPRWLFQVRDALHAEPSRPTSVAALARTVGVERTRLIRAFRRHFHTTPATYLRKLRAGEAARLLVETDAPIAEIALTAGFADQSHLNRVFKRLMGCTPAAFRARR
jgi:AraC family transcriptional regulator